MDRLDLYCFAFGVEAAFALALWGLAWLNVKASATVRIWSAALILSWGATELSAWFGLPGFETFTVLTDVALGLYAALDFTGWPAWLAKLLAPAPSGKKRPLWLVWLLISYIAQILFHLNDDNDKATELNVAFAVQILLVSSEPACQRLGICLGSLLRPLRYSNSRASAYDRRLSCWLGGPPHRAGGLRRASEQAQR